MIDWTPELCTQMESFSRGALSYPGGDGYPVVLPVTITFDRGTHEFTLSAPEHKPDIASWTESSLTLLYFADEQMRFQRYQLLYGRLSETGSDLTFTPTEVVHPRWSRRS
jgi:hypothetical protein